MKVWTATHIFYVQSEDILHSGAEESLVGRRLYIA